MIRGPVQRVVVGISIVAGLVDESYPKVILGKRQNAAEVVLIRGLLARARQGSGDAARFGVLRNHQQRHSESVNVAAAPTIWLNCRWARSRARTSVNGWWGDVVEPAAPVVPHNEDRSGLRGGAGVSGVAPVVASAHAVLVAITDGVNDVSNPRWAVRGTDRIVGEGVVRPDLIRRNPTDLLQVTIRDVGQQSADGARLDENLADGLRDNTKDRAATEVVGAVRTLFLLRRPALYGAFA